MSASDSNPSCEEFNTTLQPYVDGELAEVEHRSFAEHLDGCDECRTAVREQQKVRAALRGLVPEFAPALLRERIKIDLDAVDAELAREQRPGWRERFGAFMRGGLVFAPAAAVAVFLFVGVRPAEPDSTVAVDSADGSVPTDSSDASSAKPGQLAAALAANAGRTFEIQVPSARTLPRDVELVGASSAAPAEPFHARVEYADRSGRVRFTDQQRRGGQLLPPATHRVFRGRHVYYLARDDRGRAFLEFTVGDVHHRLHQHGSNAVPSDRSLDLTAPDFRALVRLAETLGR